MMLLTDMAASSLLVAMVKMIFVRKSLSGNNQRHPLSTSGGGLFRSPFSLGSVRLAKPDQGEGPL